MTGFISTLLTALVFLCGVTTQAAADPDRTVKIVQIAKGSSSAVVTDVIKGRAYIDYQLRAGAGQQLKVSMKASNRANYFNVLPPGSQDLAMFIEGADDKPFDGLLPVDGIYTVRVYLVRAAARRNESSNFRLSIGVTGQLLPPLPAKVDALVPGTRFHARAKVRCEPAYTKMRECDAQVVRRGTDGTATVEVHWDAGGKRRILFVKGKPEAADVPQPMTFTRNERGDFVVVFGGEERFEIPEALVYGG